MKKRYPKKIAAYTPTWNAKHRTWDVYDFNGSRLFSMKPPSDDLLDILKTFLLAEAGAQKLADKYFRALGNNI